MYGSHKTQHDAFVAVLKSKGCTPVKATTRKYTVLAHPSAPVNYYVGKAGAVRRGRTSTSSVPVNDVAKAKWLKEAEALNV